MRFRLRTLATAGAPEEIRNRFAALTPADPGLWGSMTVGEMVCHLHVCFHGAARDGIADPVRTALAPALMKWGGLRVPLRWPRGVKTVPALERGGSAYHVPGEFGQERKTLVAALEEFLAVRGNRQTHPYFGAMTPWDWMRWGYLHADHHLRQFGR